MKESNPYVYSFLDAKFRSIAMNENIAAATSANIKTSVNP
jgi:hypothetical protein